MHNPDKKTVLVTFGAGSEAKLIVLETKKVRVAQYDVFP